MPVPITQTGAGQAWIYETTDTLAATGGDDTIQTGSGNNVIATVHVPGHAGEQGALTGVVINGDSSKFLLNGKSVPAQFIFKLVQIGIFTY